MAIAILDYRYPEKNFCRLAELSSGHAIWPLGKPEGVEALSALKQSDHLVFEVRSRGLTADLTGLSCRVSAVLVEPPEIHGRYYRWLRLLGGRYHRVLTHNSRLVARLPNARFFPHGGCFLSRVPEQTPEKTERISLIASGKRYAIGHKLRHRVAEWSQSSVPDLSLMGHAYRSLEAKEEGHLPFRFSVVIENSREPGYFTEKLIDCLLCRTVPIYWGAPDIAHFFDVRGMIVCHTEEELRTAIRKAGPGDYDARRDYIEENRRRALGLTDVWRNAATVLEQEDRFLIGSRPAANPLGQAA